jgi:thioredoxin reductase (NADPH)
MTSTHETDVVIIGAGPVGLFGVFECGMLRMKCHVVDTLEAHGGQCAALYPDKPIYDIPGFPRIDAGDLVNNLVRQAAPFAPVYHLGRTVAGLTPHGDQGFSVLLSDGKSIVCRAVIIAAGGGKLVPNRPPIPGIEAYEGQGVLYRVANLEALRGKRVVIAGGGDSAVDWANGLVGVAQHIMVVHRRPKFRAAPAAVEAMMRSVGEGLVELVTPFQLAALDGSNGKVETVTVADESGQTRELQADILLALFGIASHLGPIADWGLRLHHQQIDVTPHTCETSIPGVYAVGDIAGYKGKLKLILTGFAEAASAAHAIFSRVHPDEVLHMEHSTTVGIPVS